MEVLVDGYVYQCSKKITYVTKGYYFKDGEIHKAPGVGNKVKSWLPTPETLNREKAKIRKEWAFPERVIRSNGYARVVKALIEEPYED